MRAYDYILDTKQDAIDLILAVHEAMAKSAEYHHKKKLEKMKKQYIEGEAAASTSNTLMRRMSMRPQAIKE